METTNFIEYAITEHCKERYALRIMGRDNATDIKRFILDNEDKIKTDINKLINYGELIYTGTQYSKDNKSSIIDVYLNGLWLVLADSRTKKVITLYKIDFGLNDEFNKFYISGMMEKLNTYKDILANVQESVQAETDMYKQMIEDTEGQIKEYKGMIKNLEELCVGYKTIIDNNRVKVSQANRDVAEVVNTLLAKKEF